MKYYCEEKEAVLNEFRTTENGLAQAEAERRIAENGRNKLKEAEKESLAKKFLNSLADPMIIMLIAAAAIQAVVTVLQTGGDFDLGDFADVLVILVVVIINTIMSLVQESKAEAAMDALMQMTAATSKVLRDGKVVAAGPIAEALTAENLTETFGLPILLTSDGGRHSARAQS